jgi:CHASE3 domain sensor protein
VEAEGDRMTQEQYATLDRLRTNLRDAASELELLGKLPRFVQNIDWMLDELEYYINLQRELDGE